MSEKLYNGKTLEELRVVMTDEQDKFYTGGAGADRVGSGAGIQMALAVAEACTPKWISVKDRLPEPMDMVLIWDQATLIRPAMGYVLEDKSETRRLWITMHTTWVSGVHNPSHWMPLPIPPLIRPA